MPTTTPTLTRRAAPPQPRARDLFALALSAARGPGENDEVDDEEDWDDDELDEDLDDEDDEDDEIENWDEDEEEDDTTGQQAE